MRIRRHEAVASCVSQRFKDKAYTVLLEPRITTAEVLRKPDIVAIKGRYAAVIDAQVVGEQFNLRTAHRKKSNYYQNNPGIAGYLCREYDIPIKVRPPETEDE